MSDHETTLRHVERLKAVARMYQTIPGMSPTQAEQDATAVACLAGADALRRGTWQPIEIAPKDGTTILVWADGIRFPVVYWTDHDIEWWHVTDGKHGPWPLRGASPTHWMPLPDAPTEPTR